MNIITVIFAVLAVFCFGYYAFAASYAGVASSFLWFWLLAGIGCTLIAAVAILHKRYNILAVIPKTIRIIFISLFCIGIVIFAVMEGLIISKMNVTAPSGADYVIVLGAQVRGQRVTKSLAKRLDVAYDYLIENKDTIVVCTGGKGPGEDIPESLAMKRYLVDKGIAEERIIMEDKSSSTYENLKFALEIIGDKDAKVVVATNNFHVYRAIHLGKYVGFTDVSGIAGKSDNRLLLNYMVREGLALLKEVIVH